MTLLIVPEAGVVGWFASWDLAGLVAEALAAAAETAAEGGAR